MNDSHLCSFLVKGRAIDVYAVYDGDEVDYYELYDGEDCLNEGYPIYEMPTAFLIESVLG